jgi:hypothetical protein
MFNIHAFCPSVCESAQTEQIGEVFAIRSSPDYQSVDLR